MCVSLTRLDVKPVPPRIGLGDCATFLVDVGAGAENPVQEDGGPGGRGRARRSAGEDGERGE